MKRVSTIRPSRVLLPVLAALTCVCVTGTRATTILSSFDTRSDTSSTTPLSAANTADLAVGLISDGRAFRTYLTFDLSGELAATGDTTLVMPDRGATGANESNTDSVAQIFSLFVLSADWAGVAQPGPVGTTVATTAFTPEIGNDEQPLSFTSAALTTAFNDALGGNLYLGIQSDVEGTAARSFKWLGSVEDPGFEPALTYTAIPEPATAALALIGLVALFGWRKNVNR